MFEYRLELTRNVATIEHVLPIRCHYDPMNVKLYCNGNILLHLIDMLDELDLDQVKLKILRNNDVITLQ